ncbi:hypothetical protein lerEdw1_018375 [Lerista edwardsae]|nr:hypothetical protein lerEdw1_018375 [Lerista edwardsae]
MPKKDLWVGIADPGPAAIVGSAGSGDSMISANSSPSEMSDSGYDYLSVEEKECLMFLEETLESLDTEADSGVSADDGETAEPSKHPRTWPTRDVPKELDHENTRKHKKEQKDKNNLLGSIPVVAPSSGHHSFPRNISVKNVPQAAKSAETSTNADDPKALSQITPSWGPPKHKIVDMPNDQSSKSIQTKTSKLESAIIPPPECFQDQKRGHLKGGQEIPFKDAENGMLYYSEVKTNIGKGNEATAAQQQFSLEKTELTLGKEAVLMPVSPQSNKKSSEKMISTQDSNQKTILEEAPLDSSSKQGPPTAPKPRKLPPNIILKTSKSNAISFGMDPSHKIRVLAPSNGRPRAATGDFSMERPHSLQNQQEKARQEALEKLGLPLDKEKNRGDHGIKSSVSSKPRETPRTSSRENINADDIIPNKKADQQHDQVSGKETHPMMINSPGIKQSNFKSNTLERSGVGLSSYISSGSEDQDIKNSSSLGKTSFLDKITPNFLRSSRSRPASLGMGKDFVDLKENRMHSSEQDKSDKRRSYPLQNPSKLPRPPCVSVKITPKGVTEEHRKEALKKLGLLKD